MSLHMDDLLIIRCILKYYTYAENNVPNKHALWYMIHGTDFSNIRVWLFSGGNPFRKGWPQICFFFILQS